jgi:FkbM family methyltransferase
MGLILVMFKKVLRFFRFNVIKSRVIAFKRNLDPHVRIHRVIANKLNIYDKIIVVDVGHHKGDFLTLFLQRTKISRSKIFLVGVDPIDYETDLCDVFLKIGLSSTPGEKIFNTYSEPGCNSLLELRVENRVDSIKSEKGWYCAYEIKKTGEIKIETKTLAHIVQELKIPQIHYLKIDTQGNDLQVLKSAGPFIKNVLYIQMESSVAKKENQLMYAGQSTLNEDESYLEANGFKRVDLVDHSLYAPPEADVIYMNLFF